jgi:Ca2+-binding EF-hand superfamily protein
LQLKNKKLLELTKKVTKMTHSLLVKLNDNIKDKDIDLRRMFAREDDDNKGYVPFYAFRGCIEKINQGISDEDFLKLDNKYKSKGKDGKNIYKYEEFINDVFNVR